MIKSWCCDSFSFKLNISAQVGKDSSLTIQAETKILGLNKEDQMREPDCFKGRVSDKFLQKCKPV